MFVILGNKNAGRINCAASNNKITNENQSLSAEANL